jgi:hypothetical protein
MVWAKAPTSAEEYRPPGSTRQGYEPAMGPPVTSGPSSHKMPTMTYQVRASARKSLRRAGAPYASAGK